MKMIDATNAPLEVAVDGEALIDSLSSRETLSPETYRRIRERGRKVTEQLRQKYGELDIAVPAIRELRGELPDA